MFPFSCSRKSQSRRHVENRVHDRSGKARDRRQERRWRHLQRICGVPTSHQSEAITVMSKACSAEQSTLIYSPPSEPPQKQNKCSHALVLRFLRLPASPRASPQPLSKSPFGQRTEHSLVEITIFPNRLSSRKRKTTRRWVSEVVCTFHCFLFITFRGWALYNVRFNQKYWSQTHTVPKRIYILWNIYKNGPKFCKIYILYSMMSYEILMIPKNHTYSKKMLIHFKKQFKVKMKKKL